VGTDIRHVATGKKGIVINWWCRSSEPCTYLVRVSHDETMHLDTYLEESEIEAWDLVQFQQNKEKVDQVQAQIEKNQQEEKQKRQKEIEKESEELRRSLGGL
jgi:hypothetical protein